MRVSIRDKRRLNEISPASLSAYACAAGWRRTDNYGDFSDVYTADGLPEIILPRDGNDWVIMQSSYRDSLKSSPTWRIPTNFLSTTTWFPSIETSFALGPTKAAMASRRQTIGLNLRAVHAIWSWQRPVRSRIRGRSIALPPTRSPGTLCANYEWGRPSKRALLLSC